MNLEKLKKKNKIVLDKQLTAMDSLKFKDLLIEAIHEKKSLDINASKVESIDTLCCQVIISAKNSFTKESLDFEILKPSKKFKKILGLLGLWEILQES